MSLGLNEEKRVEWECLAGDYIVSDTGVTCALSFYLDGSQLCDINLPII